MENRKTSRTVQTQCPHRLASRFIFSFPAYLFYPYPACPYRQCFSRVNGALKQGSMNFVGDNHPQHCSQYLCMCASFWTPKEQSRCLELQLPVRKHHILYDSIEKKLEWQLPTDGRESSEEMGRWERMGMGVLWGVMKCSTTDCGHGCTTV